MIVFTNIGLCLAPPLSTTLHSLSLTVSFNSFQHCSTAAENVEMLFFFLKKQETQLTRMVSTKCSPETRDLRKASCKSSWPVSSETAMQERVSLPCGRRPCRSFSRSANACKSNTDSRHTRASRASCLPTTPPSVRSKRLLKIPSRDPPAH